MFASRPKVDRSLCIGCGECKTICPAAAIRIEHHRAKIDSGKCIRCFCCQEFCPKGIISVHRSAVARIIEKLS
jgi:Fe-S-cluster-containing hydrogenase component 2